MEKFPRLAKLLIAGTVVASASTVHAFGEDLCYPTEGSTVVSCGPLVDACQPVPTSTDACKTAQIAGDSAMSAVPPAARSTVHVDATYVMAQALGFSPTDAYWIAAYDGTVDTGTFELFDNNSVPVAGAYATANLAAMGRGDFSSGGLLLHFIAPYNHGTATPPANINGLAPDPHDAQTEVTLANYRAWAVSGSVACTAGLTVKSGNRDYGTGTTCYDTGTPIRGTISAVGSAAVPFSTATGLQILQDDTEPPVLSSEFATLVANDGAQTSDPVHLADARLGVYLHLLADRISHHECTDAAVIAGPNAAGFQVDLSNTECQQGWHFLHHAWETGVDFSLVPKPDRTTEAALSSVYDELASFAQARGLVPVTTLTKDQLTGKLAGALQKFEAIDRVTAIDTVACNAKLVPFPGQPACSATAAALVGDAAQQPSLGSDGQDAPSAGGCQTSRGGVGALAVAAVVALAACRRRRRSPVTVAGCRA